MQMGKESKKKPMYHGQLKPRDMSALIISATKAHLTQGPAK